MVYVDDIVIACTDQECITKLNHHLFQHFLTKGLGELKYFLGIEVAQSRSDIIIAQRKYTLDILEERWMIDTPMNFKVKLLVDLGNLLVILYDIGD